MTTAIPVDELRERARTTPARPGYALATGIAWVLAAIGWITGRSLVVIGWLAGRTWLALCFMAEAVAWGFRNGATPRTPLPEQKPPADR